MILSIVFCMIILTSVYFPCSLAGNQTENKNSTIEVDLMLRHQLLRKWQKSKLSVDSKYGVIHGIDLPSFSFDFTEYFLSSIIERSLDSDELFLAIFLLGHKTIWGHSSPFRHVIRKYFQMKL